MSSNTPITMENAMKQAITAAFKSLEDKTYDVERKDFLDVLLADLFTILFPHNSETAPVPKKEKKVAKPKKAGEPKVEPEPVQDGPAAAGAGAPAVDPAPEPKKKAPKAKKEAPAPADKNIDWSPTWTKRVKPVVKELGLTMNITPAKQKEFAAHLNGLSKADYDARTFEEHMRDYLRASAPAPAPEPKPSDGGRAAAGDGEEVELTEVEFRGTKYLIDTRKPSAMAVYNEAGDKHLGYVGSGDFTDLKVTPDETDEE